MSRPTFMHGVAAAAIFAFVASAIIAAMTPFVGFAAVVRLVIPLVALMYLAYLVTRSRVKTGRVTTLVLWTALAIVAWWVAPPLPLYALIHVGAIWLVRSLYFHAGVLPALLDLGLSALSIAGGVWAMAASGSVFLATWTFFLVQALFTAIPATVAGHAALPDPIPDNRNFERARRQAERALGQLFTQ